MVIFAQQISGLPSKWPFVGEGQRPLLCISAGLGGQLAHMGGPPILSPQHRASQYGSCIPLQGKHAGGTKPFQMQSVLLTWSGIHSVDPLKTLMLVSL